MSLAFPFLALGFICFWNSLHFTEADRILDYKVKVCSYALQDS